MLVKHFIFLFFSLRIFTLGFIFINDVEESCQSPSPLLFFSAHTLQLSSLLLGKDFLPLGCDFFLFVYDIGDGGSNDLVVVNFWLDAIFKNLAVFSGDYELRLDQIRRFILLQSILWYRLCSLNDKIDNITRFLATRGNLTVSYLRFSLLRFFERSDLSIEFIIQLLLHLSYIKPFQLRAEKHGREDAINGTLLLSALLFDDDGIRRHLLKSLGLLLLAPPHVRVNDGDVLVVGSQLEPIQVVKFWPITMIVCRLDPLILLLVQLSQRLQSLKCEPGIAAEHDVEELNHVSTEQDKGMLLPFKLVASLEPELNELPLNLKFVLLVIGVLLKLRHLEHVATKACLCSDHVHVSWIPGAPRSTLTLAKEVGDIIPCLHLESLHEIHLALHPLVALDLTLLGAVNEILKQSNLDCSRDNMVVESPCIELYMELFSMLDSPLYFDKLLF